MVKSFPDNNTEVDSCFGNALHRGSQTQMIEFLNDIFWSGGGSRWPGSPLGLYNDRGNTVHTVHF